MLEDKIKSFLRKNLISVTVSALKIRNSFTDEHDFNVPVIVREGVSS